MGSQIFNHDAFTFWAESRMRKSFQLSDLEKLSDDNLKKSKKEDLIDDFTTVFKKGIKV